MANGRCRMHGGTCTGPATPEGRARMIAANTRHGDFTAAKRAAQHYIHTIIARTRLLGTARRLWWYLPREMAVRLATVPEELAAPIHPSNLPFVTAAAALACGVGCPALALMGRPRPAAAGISRAPRASGSAPPPAAGRAIERMAVRAEAASQAPWRQAIAFARAVRSAERQAAAAARQAQSARRDAARRDAVRPGSPGAPLREPPGAGSGGKAATRAGDARAATARPSVPPASACLAPAPHAATEVRPSRSTPAGGQSENPERNAMHRETAAEARPFAPQTRVSPTRVEALGSTILARTWGRGITGTLVAWFRGWAAAPARRDPRATQATDPATAAVCRFLAERLCAAAPAAGGRPW
jgi:hypothetical protein